MCETPTPSPGKFIDLLPHSEIDFVHTSIQFPDSEDEMDDLDPFRGAFGAGLVAADLNNDTWIDLFYVQEVGANKLYWGNPDGTFVQATEEQAQTLAREEMIDIGANAADYNGDGLLDILVLGYNDIALFENQGNQTFKEKGQELGLTPTVGYPGGGTWGDYDNDGDLDLFVCSYGKAESMEDEEDTEGPLVYPSLLFRNDGTQFTDQAHTLPYMPGEEGACMQAAFRDFDHDGDLDLLQVNDFGPWRGMTKFWENKGLDGEYWNWSDRYSETGAGELIFPMGSMYRDINGDQILDMWFSDIGKTTLLQSLGDWEWISVAATWEQSGTYDNSDVSWSVLDIDLDGSGSPGVYIGFGPHLADSPPDSWGEEYKADQPDRFLINQAPQGETPDFHQEDSVFPFPLIGNARGAATVDINHDGVPDLVTSNLNARPVVMLGACTENNRLVISLRDNTTKNTFGIGSIVKVHTSHKTQIQELSAGGRGTFSGEEPELFFGLGTVSSIESIEVKWPDGEQQEYIPECTHCQITLTRSIE